jgi:hypothetical protein
MDRKSFEEYKIFSNEYEVWVMGPETQSWQLVFRRVDGCRFDFCPDCSHAELAINLDVLIFILSNPPLGLTNGPAETCISIPKHNCCKVSPILGKLEKEFLVSGYGKQILESESAMDRLAIDRETGFCVFYSVEEQDCRLRTGLTRPLVCQLKCCQDERIVNYEKFKSFCHYLLLECQ